VDRSNGPEWLLVGNLGCEEEWAAAGRRGGARPRTLSAPARVTAAVAGTLLRAFAGPDDLLWTAEPVDPSCLAPVAGLPVPRLVSGSWRGLTGGRGRRGGVLAWGETSGVQALRERWGAGGARAEGPPRRDLPGVAGLLWALPRAVPEVAARANDRSFALEIARREGWALPGACLVGSVEELERRVPLLARQARPATATGAWVAKAPLAASGRHRLIGRSPEDVSRPEIRRHAEGLLRRFGGLVLEPWLPRLADFGATALVRSDGGVEVVSVHRLEVDRRGAFTGLELGPDGGAPEAMAPAERTALARAVEVVGRALADLGYRGPFGVDSFRWRDAAGEVRFHPLCEINARMTFGLVARALAERVLGAGETPDGRSVALRFGRSIPGPEGEGAAERIVPLVARRPPGAGAGPAAWLRIAPTSVAGPPGSG